MNHFHLLSGKFTAAKLPDVCAPRHALLNQLNHEEHRRVIYISAPAGCGKTVSTQLWLQNTGREIIWIGLDAYDNLPAIFYKLLCTGVVSIQPKNKTMVGLLKSPSFDSSPVEHTIRLLSAFEPDGKRYALALDDMHLVTNEEIRQSGLLVQKRLPSSFITVILTRNEVAEEYTAITGEDQCSVIMMKDLAFSMKEIQEYFKQCGHVITVEEAALLQDMTNGWAIGINALAMSGQTEFKQKGSRIFENYIKTKIWNKWSEDLRNFILTTSVAEEMSLELCERLTGRVDSQEVLERLRRQNAFISKTENHTYRYHQLFIQFARDILRRDNSIDVSALYKQTAGWFYEREDFLKAAHYYVQYGGYEGIIDCLYRLRDYSLNNNIEPQLAFTKEYIIGKLPESYIKESFELTARCAQACYWSGDSRGFCHYLDILYNNLNAVQVPTYIEALSFLGGADFRIPFHIYSEKCIKNPMAGVVKQERNRARTVTLTQNLPFAHRSTRDYSEFAIHTEERFLQLESAFKPLIGEEYETLIDCIRAGICYEQNNMADASAYGLSAKEKCKAHFRTEVKFCVHMILAEIDQATGQEGDFDKMGNILEKEGAQYLRPNLLACEAKIKFQNGSRDAAQKWLEHYFVTDREKLEFYKIAQYFATCRAYIVLGQTKPAIEYLVKLKKLGADYHRPLDIAEAGVLQAVVAWAEGYKKEALDILEEVLSSIQEYRFIRVISDEGSAALPILKKLSYILKKRNDYSRIKRQFLNTVIQAAYEQSKRRKGICVNIRPLKPVIFTKQQKLIVSMLAEGYTNAQIVEMTGLSIHTVKSHCATAYAKLNVNNARDAVLKAKELGLI